MFLVPEYYKGTGRWRGKPYMQMVLVWFIIFRQKTDVWAPNQNMLNVHISSLIFKGAPSA